MKKKTIIFLGIITTILLIISSTTAVPQTKSKLLKIGEISKDKRGNFINCGSLRGLIIYISMLDMLIFLPLLALLLRIWNKYCSYSVQCPLCL
ncbi:MAG: hypothetical protein JSW62_03415 [Thermoplasmatales archaeon]|nr:MAG: hypothetical protein JSW62_03415 [Thermoplasmatales archaeon]